MDTKKVFSKHYSRFKKFALIKSMLVGSIFGLLVAVLSSLLFWFLDVKAFWLSIPIFVGVTLLVGFILSQTKYKPTETDMARRLDSLGLEQRVITMTELQNDTSFIASIQRQDAQKASNNADSKLLKFAVSVPLIIGIAFTVLLSGAATTVNALSANGIIRSGKQIIEDVNSIPDTYYNVDYVINGSGDILGAEAQVVKKGESCTAVMAVADYGYAFMHWSDGVEEPYRQDFNINSDMLIEAIFERVTNVNDIPNYGDGTVLPRDPEASGDGQPDNESNRPPDTPHEYDDNSQSGAVSDLSSDYVIDGQTDYGGKIFADALKEAIEKLAANQALTEEERELIKNYYDSIKK